MSLDPLKVPMPAIPPTVKPEKTMSRPTTGHGPLAVLVCASAILAISLGIRHSFGLFLQPVSLAGGWGREAFGFAIALQNLIWGLSQPFAGLLADRIGAGRMIIVGTILYVAGLLVMALPQGEVVFILGAGILVGLGLAGTTYPLVLGAVTRATSPEKRSLALGIAMGGAAFGQFVMLPGALGGIGLLGWSGTLAAMALLALVMAPLAVPLFERHRPPAAAAEMSAGQAIRLALRHRGFQLLALGFFVCGFQVVFIATHLPAFLSDKGLTAGIGSTVLALIGLLNIPGTYYAGLWGAKWRKPMLLSWLYLIRAGIIAAFAFLPVSEAGAYGFGAAMGLVWLSTVPLTNGTVTALFGVRNLSMLGGVVFLAHQLGAFLGGWLGGVLYDRLGSYDGAWMVAMALSLLAALLNLPIREETAEPAKAAA